MRRTIIITLEMDGDYAGRTIDNIQDQLLDYCDNLAGGDCSIEAQPCIVPLSDTLVNKLVSSQPVCVGRWPDWPDDTEEQSK